MRECIYEVFEESKVNNGKIVNNEYKLFLKEEKNFCELKISNHKSSSITFIGKIWQGIEFYKLKMNSVNEAVELLNVDEILSSIDNKIFSYLRKEKNKSLEIMENINYVKNMVKSEDILSFFNNRGIFAFVFMYRKAENGFVSESIGGIIDKLLIPFNFTFSKIEESDKYIKYKLSSEINPAKSSITNMKALFRKIYAMSSEDEFHLDISINGIYIIDKTRDTIKNMKVIVSFKLDENNILTEYIINEI